MTENFGLYLVVTDPTSGYDACTEAAVECGLRYVQLRIKDQPRERVVEIAQRMRAITRGSTTRFIVNDDVRVAREVDADGVHLGQTDLALAEARRLWSSEIPKFFGLSTHDESQATAALQEAPDYIGVGPVYATPTKRIADPVLGVARAARIVAQSKLTTVAIGGIDAQRLTELLGAQIRNFAVVRYVCQHPKPAEPIRELMEIWRQWTCAQTPVGSASG